MINSSKINSLVNGSVKRKLGITFSETVPINGLFSSILIREASFHNDLSFSANFSSIFIPIRIGTFSETVPISVQWNVDNISLCDFQVTLDLNCALNGSIIRDAFFNDQLALIGSINCESIKNTSFNLTLAPVGSINCESIKNTSFNLTLPLIGAINSSILRNVKVNVVLPIVGSINVILFDTIHFAPFRLRAALNSGSINGRFGVNGMCHTPIIRDAYFITELPLSASLLCKTLRNVNINVQLLPVTSINSSLLRKVNVNAVLPIVISFNTFLLKLSNFNVDLPSLCSLSATYDHNVHRYDTRETITEQSQCTFLNSNLSSMWTLTKDEKVQVNDAFRDTVINNKEIASDYREVPKEESIFTIPYHKTILNDLILSCSTDNLKEINRFIESVAKEATRIEVASNSQFQKLFKKDIDTLEQWRFLNECNNVINAFFNKGHHLNSQIIVPWCVAKSVNGYSNTNGKVKEIGKKKSRDLDFTQPFLRSPNLNFGLDHKIIIKQRKLYIMLNNVVVERFDGMPIEVSNINISNDVDSWGWRLSANVVGKKSYERLIELKEVKIKVTINDYSWLFYVTDVKENKSFGKNNYSLSAVGHNAELTEPFSILRSFNAPYALTYQQVIDHELFDTEWTADWNTYNWLIPGDAHYYTNKSPMAVISESVLAAGAFVYCDPTLKKLFIKNRYPSYPWQWQMSVNDIVLNANPIINSEKIRVVGNDYNAVYASGNNNGVLGLVKRFGTSGDKLPENVISHNLVTTTDALRAFGSTFIADNLTRFDYRWTLPLSSQVPLISLAQLIKINSLEQESFQAISTSLNINVALSDKSVIVRQTITARRFQ